jgi:hypothetical protein
MRTSARNRETQAMKKNLLVLTLLLAACPLCLYAEPGDTPAAAPDTPAIQPQEPHDDRPPITVDREAGTLDLAATMVNAKPEWLELIATTPNGREHEAIVTVTAKPSHIHLALVTLGLEPGHPLINSRQGDQISTAPPTGPAIEVLFVYEKDGQTIETPAHRWVVDQQTGEPLPPATWLFTGSVFREWKGREYYMADEAGNAVSLVNFGDDLIVRQTTTAQDNDFQQLQIKEEIALPYGTQLMLRLRLIPEPDPAHDTDMASDKSAPREP